MVELFHHGEEVGWNLGKESGQLDYQEEILKNNQRKVVKSLKDMGGARI
jgi:hypothetical protein